MTEYDPAALERKRPDTAKLSAPAKNKHLRQTFSGKFSLADFFSGYIATHYQVSHLAALLIRRRI